MMSLTSWLTGQLVPNGELGHMTNCQWLFARKFLFGCYAFQIKLTSSRRWTQVWRFSQSIHLESTCGRIFWTKGLHWKPNESANVSNSVCRPMLPKPMLPIVGWILRCFHIIGNQRLLMHCSEMVFKSFLIWGGFETRLGAKCCSQATGCLQVNRCSSCLKAKHFLNTMTVHSLVESTHLLKTAWRQELFKSHMSIEGPLKTRFGFGGQHHLESAPSQFLNTAWVQELFKKLVLVDFGSTGDAEPQRRLGPRAV